MARCRSCARNRRLFLQMSAHWCNSSCACTSASDVRSGLTVFCAAASRLRTRRRSGLHTVFEPAVGLHQSVQLGVEGRCWRQRRHRCVCQIHAVVDRIFLDSGLRAERRCVAPRLWHGSKLQNSTAKHSELSQKQPQVSVLSRHRAVGELGSACVVAAMARVFHALALW